MPALSTKSVGFSDVGLKRQNNEDVFRTLEKEKFFILADGMGGHNAGEVAAQRAVEYMCSAMQTLMVPQKSHSIDDLKSHLIALVENTNLWVHHLGATDPTLFGMGTTLSSCLLFNNKIIYSHVGDSRIYRYRNGQLAQITRDQVVSKDPYEYLNTNDYDDINARDSLVDKDDATQETPALLQSGRKMLAQAIGTSILVAPEVGEVEAKEKDLFLICSDGLYDCVIDETIEETLTNANSLEECGNMLISLAKEGGGHDNITIVLIEICA